MEGEGEGAEDDQARRAAEAGSGAAGDGGGAPSASVPKMLLAIAEALPDAVTVHDPAGGIRYANAAFLRFIGAT